MIEARNAKTTGSIFYSQIYRGKYSQLFRTTPMKFRVSVEKEVSGKPRRTLNNN